MTTVVFVAADVDRVRRLYKARPEERDDCRVLGSESEARTRRGSICGRWPDRPRLWSSRPSRKRGSRSNQNASRLIAARAGTDIGVLRGDLERLLLYAAGKAKIGLEDVQAVVTAETSQDDWAVTNAIERGDRAGALRQLALPSKAVAFPT